VLTGALITTESPTQLSMLSKATTNLGHSTGKTSLTWDQA
jgi:hypothetical protein